MADTIEQRAEWLTERLGMGPVEGAKSLCLGMLRRERELAIETQAARIAALETAARDVVGEWRACHEYGSTLRMVELMNELEAALAGSDAKEDG